MNSTFSLNKAKYLIIQQKMIGDVLTTSILCEAIKQKNPSAKIHYLVNSHTLPVVQNNPHIDKLVLFTPNVEENKLELLRFLQQIKKEKYDVVIDVYGKLSSALITIFSGAKIKIGYQKKKYAKWLYTHQTSIELIRNKSIALAYENRFNLLTTIFSDQEIDYTIQPKIYISNSEKEEILTSTLDHHIDLIKQNYIMVNVLGSSVTKTYPLPYMAKILDEIAANFPDINFLFNYIPTQQKEVEELLSYCQPATKTKVSSFYAPSLRKFIVLTSFCKMVIGNEGGAINMGKALKLPTFAIFSPWIRKETWGVANKDKTNQTVHLRDYQPELFKNYEQKIFKKNSLKLYKQFKPEFIKPSLLAFIKKNIY